MTLFPCTPRGRAITFLLTLSLAATAAANDPPQADAGAVPPGYSMAITGSTHDFDYFMGSGWITTQHRLKATGVGSTEWDTFPATLCASLYLGGMVTVDEMYFPVKGNSGLTVRTFDPAKHQWSIYWISSKDGVLEMPAMVGGFHGNLGEFYAEDHDGSGRPIKVRFLWKLQDHDHARWEQAFSYDNRSWETNWIGEFTRADRFKVCSADGRPKR